MTEVNREVAEDIVFKVQLQRYLEMTNNPNSENAAAFRRLWDSLSESQRADYVKELRFTVVAKSGKVYRINCRGSYVGNVHVFDERDRPVAEFCCYPRHTRVTANAYLGQKLAIETDENNWLRIAVRSSHWVYE